MENTEMNIETVVQEAENMAEQAADVFANEPGLTKGEKIAVGIGAGTLLGALIYKLVKVIPAWSEKQAVKILEKKGYQVYAPCTDTVELEVDDDQSNEE